MIVTVMENFIIRRNQHFQLGEARPNAPPRGSHLFAFPPATRCVIGPDVVSRKKVIKESFFRDACIECHSPLRVQRTDEPQHQDIPPASANGSRFAGLDPVTSGRKRLFESDTKPGAGFANNFSSTAGQ